jgi:hypothetical protein
MNAKSALDELIAGGGETTADALHALFDALPPIEDTAFLRGEWEGGVLRTGHPGEQQLTAVGWVGKAFHHDDDVDPIVSRDDGGQRVANPILGKASLRRVVYRGVVTATMIYDRHPIFDHFREIDGDRVLGVMDRKGDAAPLFFFLRRLPSP